MPTHPDKLPLCVDLDGTLLQTDLLYEALLQLLKRNPLAAVLLPFWWWRGKAFLKAQIAARVELDVAALPYRQSFLEFLQSERQQGRRLVLVTASPLRFAQAVAGHLGIFSEVLASDARHNLKGANKAARLAEKFGHRQFAYAGDARADLPVWQASGEAILVGVPPALETQARAQAVVSRVFPGAGPWFRYVPRAFRFHQWVKNLLIFLPILAAHKLLHLDLLWQAGLAFLSFSLAASSAYILNDLLDLAADRQHPDKRRRPFASGNLPIPVGLGLFPLCLGGSALLALLLPSRFIGVLALYYVLTLVYSFRLKQVVLLDVLCLAVLYTLRVLAGASLLPEAQPSFWLLAFSVFLFLSLAFLKRHSELFNLRRKRKESAKGRGYVTGDLELLTGFGVSSAYIAVLVLALYINSAEVRELYAHPDRLWLVCPLVLYWLSRLWLISHRGAMHEDPVAFAVRDTATYFVTGLSALVVLLAIL